ncbi:MAG: thymidine phosphorylase [Endomicrobiia bacterium]
MRMYDIIYKKREKKSLSKEEINFVVNSYVKGEIPDYQISAFLMTIFLNGMTKEELGFLTDSMTNSGKKYNLSEIKIPKVDKHSTGGVGDGVSLSLAPLVASCGVVVPMMSGRALGHTGGTLDKLESIKGFNVNLTEKDFIKQLKKIGVAIISQSEQIAPADKKFYALRDTTATVDSIPLIAASIMSKKLAEGTDALVLDVKTGNGAFMEKFSDAKKLAQTMVDIGKNCGKKMFAVISDMNQPLGEHAGNSLEIFQAIKILQNSGPKDITELIYYLGTKMLVLAGVVKTDSEARKILEKKLISGDALKKFRQMVEMQNGDVRVVDNPEKFLPKAKYVIPVVSTKNGYINFIDVKLAGNCIAQLGAGREKISDKIDYSVGIRFMKKLGDYVEKKEPLMFVYYNDEKKFSKIKNKLSLIYKITQTKPEKTIKLIYQEIK